VAFHLLPPVPPITPVGMARIGVMGLAIVWWLTGAMPLAVTTLAALTLGVLTGAMTLTEAFGAPTYWILWFVIGAFGLAAALESTGFNRRFALAFLNAPFVKGRPFRFLCMFLLSASLMSGLMANTVVCAVWLSLATTVYATLGLRKGDSFAEANTMGIAWAANIGGIATPVGTATNPVAIAMIAAATGHTVGFLTWTVIGTLTSLLLMGTVFLAMGLILRPDMSSIARPETLAFLEEEQRRLGPMTVAEKLSLAWTGVAILLWFLPDLANYVAPEVGTVLSARLGLVIPALLVPIAMCLTPLRSSESGYLLTWDIWARQVNWGMVVFIGGVLALGTGVGVPETGIPQFLMQTFEPILGGLPEYAFVFVLMLAVILATGVMSNLVCVSIFVPLGLTLSTGLGIGSPLAIGVLLGIGPSLDYLLPSGTTTNAMVAGSGWMRVGVMLRLGLVVALVHALVTTFFSYPLAKAILHTLG
jgi:sodium-dependent dicarboxylate transporter 2/3/5